MYNTQLQTLIQVVDSGSFAKASRQLFISTVSVMKQINALESHMGVKLLNRTNHGVQLTEAGQYVYWAAKELISLSDRTILKAQEIASSEKHIIRIGSAPLRPSKIMIEKWAEIDNADLPFQIQIVSFSDDKIDQNGALKLLGKDFDCFVGVWDQPLWNSKYNMVPLSTRPYYISMARTHHLAQKEKLCWEDLNGETIMLLKRGLSSLVDTIRDEIETAHPRVNILDVPRYYSLDVFNQCIQKKCLMGSLDIWADLHPSIATLPMDWKYNFHYSIIYEKEPSLAVRAFIEAINKVK